jgi:serine protease Do
LPPVRPVPTLADVRATRREALEGWAGCRRSTLAVAFVAAALVAPARDAADVAVAGRGAVAAAVAAAQALPPDGGVLPASPPPAEGSSTCVGEYADDLGALSAAARQFELTRPQFAFCVRTTAVYECPFYGADGSLKRVRKRVVAHGTGFGLRRDGADTLVVTNEHVADWPAVTDADHAAGDVPAGCRRVSDGLRIVDDESDTYERDDIPLTRVAVDAALDVAVLRAKGALPVIPWKIGRSAALRERNAVDVRGYPLGVLRANNAGKVTSAYQHHEDREWEHDDFAVDALLSPGNSGSPVFAVSCRTRELELVGVYHAGYGEGSALNLVIGVDQLRDFLDTLKRSPRRRPDPRSLDAAARGRIALAAADEPAFPFGGTTALVRARGDGALVFAVLAKQFPVRSQPVLVIEDLPAPGDFGRPGRVWAGDGRGVLPVDRAALDADAQAQLGRVLEALRHDADLVSRLRGAQRAGAATREQFDELTRLEGAVGQLTTSQAELAQGALDLAERLTPDDADPTGTLADALALPPASPPPRAPEPATAPAALPVRSVHADGARAAGGGRR